MLDLMCSHFVLALVVRQGAGFNVRRDFASLLPLVGRHLVWPQSVLMRLREFLAQRCQGNELWRGHESLASTDFLERFGLWRGPFDEATMYFFLDEYAKEQHKDIMAMLSATQEWLRRAVKRHSTLVERNINALSSLLQLNKAERAILLNPTPAPAPEPVAGGRPPLVYGGSCSDYECGEDCRSEQRACKLDCFRYGRHEMGSQALCEAGCNQALRSCERSCAVPCPR